MRPYNFKVWAAPTTLLQIDWLGDKTFKPIDLKQSIENVILGRRHSAPKVLFRFPKVRFRFRYCYGLRNAIQDLQRGFLIFLIDMIVPDSSFLSLAYYRAV